MKSAECRYPVCFFGKWRANIQIVLVDHVDS